MTTRPKKRRGSEADPRGGAKDPERGYEMDIKHGLELFVGHFLDDVVPSVASVVHDNVESAEPGEVNLEPCEVTLAPLAPGSGRVVERFSLGRGTAQPASLLGR